MSSLLLCKPHTEPNYNLHLLTNEKNFETTLEQLAYTKPRGEHFIGVGGFFSLDAVSLRPEEVQHLTLIDISLYARRFWCAFRPLIVQTTNRDAVILAVQQLIITNASQFFTSSCPFAQSPDHQAIYWVEALQSHIERGYSWLSSDMRFQKIRRLFQMSNFCFLTADLFDEKTFDYLAGKGRIDTFYLSNTYAYACNNAAISQLLQNVATFFQETKSKPLMIVTKPLPRVFALTCRPTQQLLTASQFEKYAKDLKQYNRVENEGKRTRKRRREFQSL